MGHRLEVKVWKITFKFRLAFNRIDLFEPNLEQSWLDRLFRIDKNEIEYLLGRYGAA